LGSFVIIPSLKLGPLGAAGAGTAADEPTGLLGRGGVRASRDAGAL
jgi:hypothetical protein